MKDIKIPLKNPIPLEKIENTLEDLDWVKFDPKYPKRKSDYYGLSEATEKDGVVLFINEKSKKSKRDINYVEKILNIPLKEEPKFNWFTFKTRVKRARTLKERIKILEEALGLRKPSSGEILTIHIGKKELKPWEVDIIKNGVLLSFGISFNYILEDGNLQIRFAKVLTKQWREMLPGMIKEVWLKKGQKISVNFDWDLENKKELYKKYLKKLIKQFGTRYIHIRKSAFKGYHGKIVGKLFTPKQVVALQRKYEGRDRASRNAVRIKHGLAPGFLFDWKWGIPAGRWIPLKKWLKTHKVS